MKTKICFILLLAIISASIGVLDAGELLFNGIPRIASMTLSPDTIKPGMGDITASVDIYNDGTTDTISVGIPSGVGFTAQTLSGNDIKLEKGGHYVYVFRIIPTTEVTTDTKYTVRAIATAQGSGKAVEMSKQYTLQPRARGGDDSVTIYGTTYDRATPTPIQSPGFDFILSVFSITALLILRLTKKRKI